MRTCIGCRRTDSWLVLVRVVAQRQATDDTVSILPDPRHRLPGRGAWLHPVSVCFEQAVRRKAFGRALRLQAPVETSAVAAYLLRQHQHEPTSETTQTQGGLPADEHPMSTQQ
ncbi:MAG TPA: YlxR family protein [Dermatophilaceae bacterium]|nr:YlxR family protein [Dermatophilaceae bacterium]